MTDEEMARAYIIEIYDLRKDLELWRIKRDNEWRIVFNAFLAGLQAGRLKWHNLQEDHNDVPKRPCDVLNQAGEITTYQPDRGFLGFGGIGIQAWCEIPKYEVKEEEQYGEEDEE